MYGAKFPLESRWSDAETLAATAFPGDIGIAELEGLVQAFLDEIDFGAVDELEAFLIHHDSHPAILENTVVFGDVVCVVDDVCNRSS